MDDLLDVNLHDSELMTEIRVLGELMVAAEESAVALEQGAIDGILDSGVGP